MSYYRCLAQVGQELLEQISEMVLQKTVDGMKEEGAPYIGKCSKYDLLYTKTCDCASDN